MARVTGAILMVVLWGCLSCSVVGLDDEKEDDLPIQTEVTHDGLRFWMTAEKDTVNFAPYIRIKVSVENLTDTAIERVYPVGCMIKRPLAYREGAWDRVAWRLNERFEIPTACTTDAIGLHLEPGETATPWFRHAFPEVWVLGDSLEVGLYRFGALEVRVGPDREQPIDHVEEPLLASEPIQVKRIQ